MAAQSNYRTSDLSCDSAKVFRSARQSPVEVTRNDGRSLLLTRKSDYERHSAAVAIAADLIALALAPDDLPLDSRFQTRFAWLACLEIEDRRCFVTDIISTLRRCATGHDFEPFLVELHEWQQTAAAVAVGYTAPADLEWLGIPSLSLGSSARSSEPLCLAS